MGHNPSIEVPITYLNSREKSNYKTKAKSTELIELYCMNFDHTQFTLCFESLDTISYSYLPFYPFPPSLLAFVLL
jgi:hypothetical protein